MRTNITEVRADSSGKQRSHTKCECDYCGVEFWKYTKFLKNGTKDYCSKDCFHKSTRKRVLLDCSWCSKKYEVTPSKLKNSKHGYHFCSRECKDKAQRVGGITEIQPSHYGDGRQNYRNVAIRELGLNECNRCGYKKEPKILQVHHKDRDRTNNDLSNLEILCPNCHVLEHMGL